MKFTITRINRQNQLMVSLKSIDRFWERIAKDDAKQSVANFRMSAPLMEGDYHNYIGMKQWQQVYPAAEFGKDESGSLIFKKSNELMMLHFINLFAFLSAVAAKLCRMGMSEEEAFTHIRRNNWNDATEEEFREIVGSAYATHSKDRKTEKASSGRKGRADILQMKNFLQSKQPSSCNITGNLSRFRQ